MKVFRTRIARARVLDSCTPPGYRFEGWGLIENGERTISKFEAVCAVYEGAGLHRVWIEYRREA